jgi:predicted HicB family RNase H-like nuclease
VLYVRVSEPLHTGAVAAADGVGMSVGEWVRWIIAKEVHRDCG